MRLFSWSIVLMLLLPFTLTASLKERSFHFDGELHLLFTSDAKNISYSSYRLSAPDRIVIEFFGEVLDGVIPKTVEPVSNIEVKDGGDTLRLIFYLSGDAFYSILNRDNNVLVSFSSTPLDDDSDFSTVFASLLERQRLQQKQKAVAPRAPTKLSEKELVAQLEERLKKQKAVLMKQQEKERQRQAELLRRKQEEERKRQVELLRKKQEEERQRLELARKKAEKERKRKEEEARIAAERERKRREALLKKEQEERLRKEQEARQAALLRKRQEEERRQLELARKKAEEERKRKEEEARIAAERDRKRKEALLLAKQEKERKRQAELLRKKQEEEKRRQAELLRKKQEEERKRQAELLRKKQEEERKRQAELLRKKREEEKRQQAELLRRQQQKTALADSKQAKTHTSPERTKMIKTASGDIVALRVVRPNGRRSVDGETPELSVTTIRKKGVLNNLYFRKYPKFSRITMELTGDVDYQLKEIKGGFVINIFNFKTVPRRLLNIIDTRYFNSVVKYIYPKKVGDIFKIYIKADKGTAVRKSKEGLMVNFDFYTPTIE